MKKTQYFVGPNQAMNQFPQAVHTAVQLRDQFLTENKDKIAKIEEEDLFVTKWANDQHVFVTIKLSYYLIEE